MSFRRAKKSAHVFRQSALFLPADLAVPCPKRPCGGVLLKRPCGPVPFIPIVDLAVAELTPLPRRSKPAAPLLAPVARRPGGFGFTCEWAACPPNPGCSARAPIARVRLAE